MLYIDQIDDFSVRFSDEPDGAGNVKIVAIPVESRMEVDERIWMRQSSNIEHLLNNASVEDIVFEGQTYSSAESLVVAMNAQIGALLNQYSSEALALFSRMTIEPDTSRKQAINTFILSLKSAGVWDKLDVFRLYDSHDEQSALLNWISTSYNATVVNSPTFISDDGFTGDGAASCLNSNYIPASSSFMGLNDATIGFYSKNFNIASPANKNIFGSVKGGVSCFFPYATRGATSGYLGYLNSGLSAESDVVSGVAPVGIYSVVRENSSGYKVYENKNNIVSKTKASTSLPTGYIFELALGDGSDNPAQFLGANINAVWYGKAISQSDHEVLYDAIMTYETAINPTLTQNILFSGSSTTAAYAGADAVADYFTTTGTKTDISNPGDTISAQKTAYQALSSGVKSALNVVFLMIGGNDLNPATNTSASVIAAIKDLITTIKSSSPNAVVYNVALHPFKQRLIDLYGAEDGLVSFGIWQDVWEAVRKEGSSPITEANYYVDGHVESLSDGSYNLASKYDTGDHIHMNNQGKSIIVSFFRQKLAETL